MIKTQDDTGIDEPDSEPPAETVAVPQEEWNAMMATMHYMMPKISAEPSPEALVDTESDSGSDSGPEGEDGFRLPWAARAAERSEPRDFEEMKDEAFESLREGRPLYTLPEAVRSDKEVVLAAIGAEGAFCFDYIADVDLRTRDREVGLALVASDGSLLEQLSEELRADRLIVQTAVRNCSDVLKVASPPLQADRGLKAIAAAREKEEKQLLKRYMEKACGPGMARCM